MGYTTRYKGGFVSRKGETWYVAIQMRDDRFIAPNGTADLTFEAEECAVVEWETKDKEEVMQGSTLTLRIESPGDRTYLDLYTVTPGAVRAVVYRGEMKPANVFWVGMLDPEFYEEPYERLDKYVVTLTFSDFGVLQRFKPSLTGANTLRAYIEDALTQAGYSDILSLTTYVSTKIYNATSGQDDVLENLLVRAVNFTDEEGVTMAYNEVLEGILQPLALRMVQRAGHVVIYDLNYIATATDTVPVVETVWDGDSQTLSTDKVANAVKITFSPYGDSKLLDTEITADDVKDALPSTHEFQYVLDSLDGSGETEAEVADDVFEFLAGFILHMGRPKDGFSKLALGDSAMLFYNEPKFTDTDDAGILAMYPRYNGPIGSGFSPVPGAVTTYNFRRELWPTEEGDKMDVPPVLGGGVTDPFICRDGGTPAASWNKKGLLFSVPAVNVPSGSGNIKITLPVIFDNLYNPFNSSAEYNGSLRTTSRNGIGAKTITGADYKKEIQEWYNFVYVPVKIVLKGDDGSMWHYVNNSLAAPVTLPANVAAQRFQHTDDRCYWASGEGDWNECFLCYYDMQDRVDSSGIGGGGWKNNKPICYNYTGILPSSWEKLGEGETLSLPPVPGELTIHVGAGIAAFWEYKNVSGRYVRDAISSTNNTDSTAWANCAETVLRWMLYKMPSIEVTDSDNEPVACDDIEYTGTVNEEAQEDIEIDTVCGTGAPDFAKGLYLIRNANGTVGKVSRLTRQDRTTSPEQLLIGTLFSQYHDRCIMLGGEMEVPAATQPYIVYIDANTPDAIFMAKGEVMDLIAGTTDITLVEVRPDDWTSK